MILKTAIIFIILFAQLGTADSWIKIVGNRDPQIAAGFTKTHDGGFMIAGAAFGPDGHDRDPLLVRFDSSGAVKWQKTFDFKGFIEQASSVERLMDGSFVITGPRFIMKISGTGEVEWSRRFMGVVPLFVRATHDNGLVAVGYKHRRPWVAKLNSSGVAIWEYLYSCGLADQLASTIVETSDGGFLIGSLTYCKAPFVGVNLIKINSTGQVLWHKIYSNSSIDSFEHHILIGLSKTNDGGYIIALNFQYKIKILKLDEHGNIAWNRIYDLDISDAAPTQLQQTADGGFIFVHAWHVLKINPIGDVHWYKQVGVSVLRTTLIGISQQKDGSYVIGGSLGRKRRSSDFVLFKLENDGALLSSCVKIKSPPVIVTNGDIEVFDNTNLKVRPVQSTVRDHVVSIRNFESDPDTCLSN